MALQQPMASGSTPFHAPVAPPQQQQQQMPPPMQQQTHFGGNYCVYSLKNHVITKGRWCIASANCIHLCGGSAMQIYKSLPVSIYAPF